MKTSSNKLIIFDINLVNRWDADLASCLESLDRRLIATDVGPTVFHCNSCCSFIDPGIPNDS